MLVTNDIAKPYIVFTAQSQRVDRPVTFKAASGDVFVKDKSAQVAFNGFIGALLGKKELIEREDIKKILENPGNPPVELLKKLVENNEVGTITANLLIAKDKCYEQVFQRHLSERNKTFDKYKILLNTLLSPISPLKDEVKDKAADQALKVARFMVKNGYVEEKGGRKFIDNCASELAIDIISENAKSLEDLKTLISPDVLMPGMFKDDRRITYHAIDKIPSVVNRLLSQAQDSPQKMNELQQVIDATLKRLSSNFYGSADENDKKLLSNICKESFRKILMNGEHPKDKRIHIAAEIQTNFIARKNLVLEQLQEIADIITQPLWGQGEPGATQLMITDIKNRIPEMQKALERLQKALPDDVMDLYKEVLP